MTTNQTNAFQKKEVAQVLIHPYQYEIDRRRRREQRAAVRCQRLIAEGRPPRRIRNAVGHQMIRIGSRLAAEPARQGARSL